MRQFNLVVGAKRSGTSALMHALKTCGVPIGGFKYPQLTREKETGESLDMGFELPDGRIKNENPTGFWEYSSVVFNGLSTRHLGYDGKVVKVISQVLPASDPRMVDKIIYIVRDPRKVLTSRVTIDELKPAEGSLWIDIQLKALLQNEVCAFYWMCQNLKQCKIVVYEELIATPVLIMADVCRWLGMGEGNKVDDAIQPKFNRSANFNHESQAMDDMIEFYDTVKNRDMKKILTYDVGKIGEEIKELYVKQINK